MDYGKLEEYTFGELKDMAATMDIPVKRSKLLLVNEIKEALKEYERYKRNKLDKYTRKEQLGAKGKEGTTYLVENADGKEYAMKTFRKQKSSANLRKEADLQKRAADEDAAPNVLDIDTVSKYIVMERMDKHFIDVMKQQGGDIKESQQRQIIKLYKKMDKAGVFHGDSNIMNYMLRKGKIYMIDFGMAKEISSSLVKTLGTSQPNMDIMTLGIVLKLKELGCPASSYSFFRKHLTDDQIIKFGL